VPAGAGRPAPTTPDSTRAAARRRLLLEGPIVSTLLRLAAPNVVVNVVVIAVTASVDAYFVGRLGATALAGLSLVFPLMILMQQMPVVSKSIFCSGVPAGSVSSGPAASATPPHAVRGEPGEHPTPQTTSRHRPSVHAHRAPAVPGALRPAQLVLHSPSDVSGRPRWRSHP
jgi:hypothetical protein